MELQEWYRPPLSPCQVWWRLDLACHWGGERKFDVFFNSLSFMLLNDKVCERNFAMKALQFRNGLGTVG